MAGRTSAQRAALERQNAAIMAVFERAGFEQIAPDIIQPADIFLERSGEDIRARTFVFNDPEGQELCLRPDLTVPACRFHLSHAAQPEKEARYSYLGPAFRFPDEKLSPQEFTQAGLEWFAAADAVHAEARILKLAISALEAAGASGLKITLGDVGLFASLLADTHMPTRWRRRLAHQFWRPEAFKNLLHGFATPHSKLRTSISDVIDFVGDDALTSATAWIDQNNVVMQGTRTIQEIATRLGEKKLDRSEQPLKPASVETIENYLNIEGSAVEVFAALNALKAGEAYGQSVAHYQKRLDAMEEQGLNPKRFFFSANFGREIEYYTGFVFQIEAVIGNEVVSLAGGGRYDELLSDLGAPTKISAIGCAIHTERLAMVLS